MTLLEMIEVLGINIIAIGAVCTASIAIMRFTRLGMESSNKWRDWVIQPVNKEIKEIKKKQKEIEAETLRGNICNVSIPLVDRVNAGDKYIMLGENGEISLQVRVLRQRLEKQIRERERKAARR